MKPAASPPPGASPDPQELLRSRSYLALLVLGAVIGVPVATAAYFFHITTFYYIVKWVPTIVVGMGFAPSSAGYVLSWLNVGGATYCTWPA